MDQTTHPCVHLGARHECKEKDNEEKQEEEEEEEEEGEQREKEEEEEEEESKAADSAIGEHLVANVGCLNPFDRKQLTILTVAWTQTKLNSLEALLIKKLKPDLCKQKEFVCSLHILKEHVSYKHTCAHLAKHHTYTPTPFVTQ